MDRAEKRTSPRNLRAQTRPLSNPYEVYVAGEWEWRILKHYQRPEKEIGNRYARVFCAVRSPFTYGGWDYGDVYLHDIERNGVLVESYQEEN